MPNDNLKANPDITVTLELDAADAAVISDGLRAYHFEPDRIHGSCLLAMFVRDSQTGKVLGGLHGQPEFGLVNAAWFFLRENWRRAGT
jgi:hypothetical protein